MIRRMNKTPRDKYNPWPSTRLYAIETRSGTEWDWFAGATSDAEALKYLRTARKAGSLARAVTADGKVFKRKLNATKSAYALEAQATEWRA
jgi:hypothetical protein